MKDSIKKLQASFDRFSSSSLARALVLIVLFSLLIVLIFAGKRSYRSELHEGDISLVDIYAPYDLTYPGEVDEVKTQALRERILENLLPVYDIKVNYWEEERKILSEFFAQLEKVKQLKDVDDNGRIEKLKKNTGLEIENKLLFPFLHQDVSSFKEVSLDILNILSSRIITDAATIEELGEDNRDEIIVRNKRLNVEGRIPRSDLYIKDDLKPIIKKELISKEITPDELRGASINLLLNILSPNLVYNKAETEIRHKALLEGMLPVYNQILVKKNESIIGKGQRISKTHLLQLDRLTKKETGRARISYLGGLILLVTIFIVMIPVYLSSYRKKIYKENKNLYLITIIAFFTAFLARTIITSPLSSYFIPIAAAAMLLCILLDESVSFMITLMLSIFAAVIAGNKFSVMVVSLVGGLSAIYFIRGVRRRSQILKAGLFVGLSKFAVICGIGLLNTLEPNVFLKEGCWGVASGIISAGIVMLLLPVFEFLFNITTNITLLELSDLNHPLLKKMVLHAPGTYHHSLVVGNLAEAASDAVGANSLLARVGAYYHDIGKTEKAEYFSENETSRKSPHEKLTPSMSALIIQSHVKDGIELARKHKLNRAIVNFISQHHGTSLIYYFYQRALEKIGDEEVLKEEAFRYPGPKPQSKETAIVLLADAVEASSHTLNDPTPSRIKGLVQKLINNKFIDNQLDECDLTLKDLNKIVTAFVRILTGIFHTRVEYPEENKNKSKGRKKTQ